MLGQKVIGPTIWAWISPIVLVRKPNNEVKIAIDQFIKITKSQRFLLPMIEVMFAATGEGNAKYFKSAYTSKAYLHAMMV